MTYDYRVAADDTVIDAWQGYNLQLAKLLQKLKKDAGAALVKANYKGTGRQRFRRQIFIRFKNDFGFDLWLENDRIEFGGVINRPQGMPKSIPYSGRTAEEVYAEVAKVLKPIGEVPKQ